MKIAFAALAAVGGLLAAAPAAQAQYVAGWNTAGQWDRGGDYRCDAYWDANRTDCDAAWRTPRGGARYHSGYRAAYDRYGHGYGHRYAQHAGHYGQDWRRYGQSHGYGHGYGHHAPADAYPAAYGRPDLVYGGSGHGYGAGARDPRRIDWCRRNYRSYDPHSGYYRAYSGRLGWCG